MNEILKQLMADLKSKSSTHYKKNVMRFFTTPINCIGVPKDTATQIGKKYFAEIKTEPKEVIFRYCKQLFEQAIIELSGIACIWAYSCRKQYEHKDIILFESWLQKYVHDWAVCDTMCATVLKAYFAQFPDEISRTKKWATAKNPYVRRASAVALIYFEPANHLQLRLARAQELMQDKDVYVQKGYGWMLKKASQHFPEAVYDFVILHKKVMPRLALRYAIEKLPKDMRNRAMVKE
jgi:3-methyladenine DNA glycosylase AlkD